MTKPLISLEETSSKLALACRSFASALVQPQFSTKARELLPKVLEYAERLQLRRVAIADRCQVSEATVSRWASGRVQPHPIIAEVAIDAVCKLALEKAKEYDREVAHPVEVAELVP